jgi:hypothetical protein
MKYIFEITAIIYNAVELMKNSFGGTDVEIISKNMYRLKPDVYSQLVG